MIGDQAAFQCSHTGSRSMSGALHLFTNRRRKTAKVLHFDGTGLRLYAKRLARGRFAPLWDDGGASAGEQRDDDMRIPG